MMTSPSLVVVGDSLLDRDITGSSSRTCPDSVGAPVIDVEATHTRPGGAALAALMSAAAGVATTLVTPLADDADGRDLRERLEAAGVRIVALGHEGETRVKTRVRAGGGTVARLDSGGPGRPTGSVRFKVAAALDGADAILLSCYGGGVSEHPDIRAVLSSWIDLQLPLVWDPHPRGAEPVPHCTLVTPNLTEARALTAAPAGATGDDLASRLRTRWSAKSVAVTAGRDGAWVASRDGVQHLPSAGVADGDPCGAGDRFSAAAAVALAEGGTAVAAARLGVRAASAFVASGGVGRLSAGGPAERPLTVVATGGCFDVFHAGHLSLLQQSRRLGDRLVVLVNSDASVARLKGCSRPIHRIEDRVRVLRALSCVDSVVVFDEDDPREALRRIRPQIWVKSGPYTVAELPEADLVRSWGGQVVTLPPLPGRSTTAAVHALNGELR